MIVGKNILSVIEDLLLADYLMRNNLGHEICIRIEKGLESSCLLFIWPNGYKY